MRSLWGVLKQSLAQSIRSLESTHKFQTLREKRPEVRRFDEPVALVDYLTGRGRDFEAKDLILEALVETVQSTDDLSELAQSLLWLGLWPALDAVYHRCKRLFPGDPERIVSEIGDRFSTVIATADLSKINRLAATLVRNTEREIRADYVDSETVKALRLDFSEGDMTARTDELDRPREPTNFGITPGMTAEQQVAAIRDWLTGVVGDDADLVLGATIYGESHREVGARLGLTHAAARKRFQRAMVRVRAHFRKKH